MLQGTGRLSGGNVDQGQRLVRLRRGRPDRQLGVRPRVGQAVQRQQRRRRAERAVRFVWLQPDHAGVGFEGLLVPPGAGQRAAVLRPHVDHVGIEIQDPPQQRRAFVEPALAQRFDRAAVFPQQRRLVLRIRARLRTTARPRATGCRRSRAPPGAADRHQIPPPAASIARFAISESSAERSAAAACGRSATRLARSFGSRARSYSSSRGALM